MLFTDRQKPLFPLGQVVMTHGADEAVGGLANAFDLLLRHVGGDWGDLDSEDIQANEDALSSGARLLSSYALPSGTVWIITEADRSITTILTPSEY
jgi:hypothetical protein